MQRVLAGLTVFALSAIAQAGDLPDPNLTPGVTNPDVHQSNIQATICTRGWTTTIRPPASYTDQLKVTQIGQYAYADTNPAHYEEDHLISLELGGHPQDPKNLWPQPHNGKWNSGMKDKLENVLNHLVCSGKMTLAQAQKEISTDWTASYKKHMGTAKAGKKPAP